MLLDADHLDNLAGLSTACLVRLVATLFISHSLDASCFALLVKLSNISKRRLNKLDSAK